MSRVLVVDDEETLVMLLCALLQEQGYAAVGLTSGAAALKVLREQEFELLLCDLMMPEMDGIALLKAGQEIDPRLMGIVMTGQGSVESAVEAMKQGACDYVLKPFKTAELVPVLAKALELRCLRLENIDLRQTLALYELTTTLRFSQDLGTLLDKTAEIALQQTRADEASIMLPTQDGGDLFVAAVRGGGREHLQGHRVPYGEGIAGWVARYCKVLTLEGPAPSKRFGTVLPRAEIKVSLCLPMVTAGQLVGVLNLNHTRQHRAFAPGEIKALQLLTSITAEALGASRWRQQEREAEERYRAIFDNAVVGIFQTTPEGRFLKANLAQARMLGYDSPQELIAAISDIGSQVYVAKDRREEFKRRLETRGKVQGFEIEAQRRDGSSLWMLMSARAFRDAEGVICGYEGTAEDITERKKAEEILNLFRKLIDQSNDAIEVVDPETGRFLDVNETDCLDLGYSREELLALSVFDIDPMLDRSSFTRAGEELRKSGPQLWEGLHRRKNGSTFPVEVNLKYVQLERNYVVAVVRDITARKRREVKEQVFSQVREAVWKMQTAEDLDQVLRVVEEGLRALEVPFREMAINRIDLLSPEPVTTFHPGEERLPHQHPAAKDLQIADTSTMTILQIWKAGQPAYRPDLETEDLYGERENIAAFYGGLRRSVLDVPFSHGTLAVNSEQPQAFTPEHIGLVQELAGVLSEGFRRQDDLKRLKETQQQLYQSQKLESLGRLAGGVAHDFNNLITVIDGYSRLALKRLPQEDGLLRSAIEEVQRAGARAEALVRQLLAFSRRQPSERRILELNQLVSGVQKMLGRLIGEDVELRVELAPEAGTVEADPGQLEQVLMNLVVNARDAMPQGGQLSLATAACQVDEETARSLGMEAGGRCCRLVVRDSGVGMSPQVQQHIFEPFFTTKEAGQGTGLGLATVWGIVRSHRGGIRVQSRPGEGTAFEIYLPAAVAEGQESARQDQAPAPRGAETILLVEDDDRVRRLVCHILDELGYAVLEARGAEEALQQCSDHPGPIALLLTDLVMPGMNGYDLAARIAALRPGVKALYMSGYAERSGRPQDNGVPFLPKPFTPEQLAQQVRRVLDGGPQS